ncbi:unnamed protein product [Rotaria socialis]|uniref:Uncharacterized protein n=1 Tax=Rotaria socialis TaxID=392032 RepID=A0A820J3Z1_9BILA|nr:unnamed protein product [Rotaria socialis]CAF4321183.1 unnamed protein product [Rotaria socialis]CAF4926582.1 unnamed protein product [Rotaria socialis]
MSDQDYVCAAKNVSMAQCGNLQHDSLVSRSVQFWVIKFVLIYPLLDNQYTYVTIGIAVGCIMLAIGSIFLMFNCISIECVLRFLLAVTDWFHACAAVERLLSVILNAKFGLMKSKKLAKLLIIIFPLLISISLMHDPIHRGLIYDEEAQRTWRLLRLKPHIESYNSFINIFHFITPFALKLISTISTIFCIAKNRTLVKNENSYSDNIKEQFHKYKNLIISSSCLVILALPPLILNFASGCTESVQEPSVFLAAYFVSIIPSLIAFVIFVSTSQTYKKKSSKVWFKENGRRSNFIFIYINLSYKNIYFTVQFQA